MLFLAHLTLGGAILWVPGEPIIAMGQVMQPHLRVGRKLLATCLLIFIACFVDNFVHGMRHRRSGDSLFRVVIAAADPNMTANPGSSASAGRIRCETDKPPFIVNRATSSFWATALRRTHLYYLSTPRLAELGDALDVCSVGASPAPPRLCFVGS